MTNPLRDLLDSGEEAVLAVELDGLAAGLARSPRHRAAVSSGRPMTIDLRRRRPATARCAHRCRSAGRWRRTPQSSLVRLAEQHARADREQLGRQRRRCDRACERPLRMRRSARPGPASRSARMLCSFSRLNSSPVITVRKRAIRPLAHHDPFVVRARVADQARRVDQARGDARRAAELPRRA